MLRFVSILMLAISLGCQPPGPRTYPVSGTVTFDGEAIVEGDIIFVPSDSSLAPDAGKIVEGQFSARAKEGNCRVEITALNINADTPVVMGSPLAENFIPEQYNTESELTAEVSPDGENSFSFSLKSVK